MSTEKTQPLSDNEISMIKAIAELQVNARLLAEAVKKLEDANEGTVQRKGLKERVALAEENINAHKSAWIKNEQELKSMEGRINSTLQEAFLEIDRKIAGLADSLKTQQGWIAKSQPYMNVIMWAVGLIAGWLFLQILGGDIQIVRVP